MLYGKSQLGDNSNLHCNHSNLRCYQRYCVMIKKLAAKIKEIVRSVHNIGSLGKYWETYFVLAAYIYYNSDLLALCVITQ